MSYQHILYEEKEQIGILTLNRPEKRNALGIQAELEMTHCLKVAGHEKTVRVIIIKAAGDLFCSGHDRLEILNQPINDVRRFFQTCIDMYDALRSIPQPVIAQVQGIAMAGGCHLVAGCDLAVAAEKKAKFSMSGNQDRLQLFDPHGGRQPGHRLQALPGDAFYREFYWRPTGPGMGVNQPGGPR